MISQNWMQMFLLLPLSYILFCKRLYIFNSSSMVSNYFRSSLIIYFFMHMWWNTQLSEIFCDCNKSDRIFQANFGDRCQVVRPLDAEFPLCNSEVSNVERTLTWIRVYGFLSQIFPNNKFIFISTCHFNTDFAEVKYSLYQKLTINQGSSAWQLHVQTTPLTRVHNVKGFKPWGF